MADIHAVTAHNRDAWNAIASRRRVNCQEPSFFTAGGSTLDPPESAAIGDVRGLRVLNLQCSSGNEALSLAAQGALVTGVDISDIAIGIAREQADAAGLSARFVAADVFALPDDLIDFDVVYSSAGITCWLPDLQAWAHIVAGTLRTGGRFVLNEHHPLWEVVAVDGDRLRVGGNYFGRNDANSGPPVDPERQVHIGAEPVEIDGTTFIWPVGDVVTALARAGLRIQELSEFPVIEMFTRADASEPERAIAQRIPAAYLLVASKD